jgi:hypothetical protein
MVDNCDLFTSLHAIEPKYLVVTITEITPLNHTQFTPLEMIPLKGE